MFRSRDAYFSAIFSVETGLFYGHATSISSAIFGRKMGLRDAPGVSLVHAGHSRRKLPIKHVPCLKLNRGQEGRGNLEALKTSMRAL